MNTTLKHRQWITFTVMLVAVIEVLDMTIVNVSLPHMMGSLSANADQITWVLTSYIVAAAIFMPLTGFLVKRVGRRRLLLVNILGFGLASALCGLSTDMTQIVLFRTLQGCLGAGLVPLSQYILRDTYPKAEHGKAMAIWGVGVMAGPVLGPTLGGYITQTLSWRWVFYINIPVCSLAFLLALRFITESTRQKEYIDWIGMGLLATAIGALQLFLDRGNTADWFSSKLIIGLCVAWVFSLSYFIWRGWSKPNNIINLKLFRNKNFLISELMLLLFTAGILATIALQPMMMEQLMGYPTLTTGLLMAPRGIASAVAMMFVGRFNYRTDNRLFVLVGLTITLWGTYLMAQFTINTPQSMIINAGLIQGLGMGLVFVPLSTLAFSTLPTDAIAEASGLFSFARSLGSSIGISILSTYLSRSNQRHWHQLITKVDTANPSFQHWLSHLPMIPSLQTKLGVLSQQISSQANMLSFINCFYLVMIGFVVIAPLTFLLKREQVSLSV
jgi:MFS transporter, DHA2 family, multidrug resistance protein